MLPMRTRTGFPMPRNPDHGLNSAARIFRTIWRRPRISRVGIADRLGLDKSTVTNQVNQLIELGLIEEVEEGRASVKGGRRPIQLGIRRSFGCILGIEVQADAYIAVAVDLAGEILGEHHGLIRTEDFTGSVREMLACTQAVLGARGQRILGVGVGLAGLVDHRQGLIQYSVPLSILEPFDFHALVSADVDVPCFVENDANCCAWGELAFHRSEELRDFLFALVEARRGLTSVGTVGGIGVGFGLALGGRVHGGAHGSAGEFRSTFCEGPGDLQFSLTKEELGRWAEDDAILHRTADELARNMAMLIHTLDIQKVFVGGDITSLPLDFSALLRRRLDENWMYPVAKDIEIRSSSLGQKAVAFGAAGMMLDRLISEGRLPGLG